jgi:hypothetical protein
LPARPTARPDRKSNSESVHHRRSFTRRQNGRRRSAAARQLGVSRSWASREASAAGTRLAIAEVFEANRERINAVFDRTLDLN